VTCSIPHVSDWRTLDQVRVQYLVSASEIVRRAERCIGLAIRKGQAEGRIRRRGQSRGDGSKQGVTNFLDQHDLTGGGNSVGVYDLTDGVSDEVFEKALGEAVAVGLVPLSRQRVAPWG